MARSEGAITYRVATTADVDALARMRWQMETERHPDIQADYAAYLAAARQDIHAEIERGAHVAFLAETEGEVVACAILIWWTMLPTLTVPHRKRGYVSSVYTAPAWRRRGVARQLMEQLIARAREMGMQRLVLWASDMGRPLYLDQGFEPSPALELNL
ncbi:MAG TPA: GNAT family N-acetyltransferase [Ktedonobacterales bacterium]|jgi:GNAT superfamily N-acetyltransferase|nr:GNAT family N-acetyltransferase [Ktedonobacterales bacterium]